MSKQSWKGSTLLNPEPPVLVSCGGLEKPNLITIGWTGTICTQPSMVSISVRRSATATTSFRKADSLPSICPPKRWCVRWTGAA